MEDARLMLSVDEAAKRKAGRLPPRMEPVLGGAMMPYNALNNRPYLPPVADKLDLSSMIRNPLPSMIEPSIGVDDLARIERKLDRILENQEHRIAGGIWIAHSLEEAVQMAKKDTPEVGNENYPAPVP